MARYVDVFTEAKLSEMFPASRSNDFFEALFGDAEEGSYDIQLAFAGAEGSTLNFEFNLNQRPGKCLVCSLTYGLPQVFSRHPIINVQGLAEQIAHVAGNTGGDVIWKLGITNERSHAQHYIPLTIELG
ncbi:pancreas/duodenum homeobox protein 1 [Salidesulfovibrio onnuriiensis]|uniref:pancreas/duodenum homeobox protein 1 n=1 Tax=Salidesulfovibrio onnuriiensis TaxID=2583823 RepID=UPI0011CC578C|nr:pancreas/duodenum homeobox protein 1 [Salidesulfovibrio onnuriiensis]